MTEAKDKIQSILRKVLSSKKYLIACVAVGLLIVAAIIAVSLLTEDNTVVDTEYMVSLLENSSELTTAKLHYTGMTEFEDKGIAFINKSDFIMVYEATARIGINLEQVKVSADDIQKIIYVTIPDVSVQEVKIDASTIKYFDQSFAVFNFDEKEDSNKAIALAEEAAIAEIQEMGVLKMAQDQSATLVMGILANAIPDGYEIKII